MSKKLWHVVFLLLTLVLVAFPAFAQPSDEPRQPGDRDTHLGEVRDARAMYDALLELPSHMRATAVLEMPGAAQAAIWRVQLSDALATHSDLNAEQRAVIRAVIELLTPELFSLDSSDPSWGERVDGPLRDLQTQIEAAFPDKTVARNLFATIGHDRNPLGTTKHPEKRRRVGSTEDSYPDCWCSVYNDLCNWSMVGGSVINYECRNAWCLFKNRGCGPLFLYNCDGLCFVKYG